MLVPFSLAVATLSPLRVMVMLLRAALKLIYRIDEHVFFSVFIHLRRLAGSFHGQGLGKQGQGFKDHYSLI